MANRRLSPMLADGRHMDERVAPRPAARRIAAWTIAAAVLAAVGAGCSGSGEVDLTGGGELFDGRSLEGWHVLSGSWSVDGGAVLGVGPKARIVRAGRYPASYRLRFEVAPRQGAEASWAVAVPAAGTHVLQKGQLRFSGGPDDWRGAWQAVEVVVRAGEVRFALPGLAERPNERRATGKGEFRDRERARALWQEGFRFFDRADGLSVLAPPPETWRRDSRAFREGETRGDNCLEGRHRGIALVIPCTARDGAEAPDSCAARFRNIVVDPL